jgi:hypothetical protein
VRSAAPTAAVGPACADPRLAFHPAEPGPAGGRSPSSSGVIPAVGPPSPERARPHLSPRHRTATAAPPFPLTRLAVSCAAGLRVLAGCADGPADTSSTMSLTVSAATDVPVTVYFDTREQDPSGLVGPSSGPTPVELSPERPSAVVAVPYDRPDWLQARVQASPDRPAGITVGCRLRAADGRVLDEDATGPHDPVTDDAGCAGAVP